MQDYIDVNFNNDNDKEINKSGMILVKMVVILILCFSLYECSKLMPAAVDCELNKYSNKQ